MYWTIATIIMAISFAFFLTALLSDTLRAYTLNTKNPLFFTSFLLEDFERGFEEDQVALMYVGLFLYITLSACIAAIYGMIWPALPVIWYLGKVIPKKFIKK